MAARANPAAELAVKMVEMLRAQRDQGGVYPLTLKQLAELTDASAADDLRAKAAKNKTFATAVVVAQKKAPDTPLALVEDRDRLVDSRLLLGWVVEQACTPAAPAQTLDKVVKKVDVPLRDPLKAVLVRRLQEDTLPETVAAVTIKGKPYLYLKRMPPPKPPPLALAEKLVQALRDRRQRVESYPLSVQQVIDQVAPGVDPALLKKALNENAFKAEVVMAVAKSLAAPVALAGDEARLFASPLLIEHLLTLARTDSNQAIPATDLKKKLAKPLQQPFAGTLHHLIAARSLPAGIGLLHIKKKEYLFLLRDIADFGSRVRQNAGESPTRVLANAATESATSAPPDFAAAFEAAYARLDRERGGHDFVSLVDLRRALPYDRQTFDGELRKLRRAGLYTLSTAEGRHGLTLEEQDAAIREEGTLLLSVSRKRQ
jgi:hypothetical protein